MLKLLHLSDIHFGASADGANDPDAYYRDQLVDEVLRSADDRAFDAILVTGDIAATGKATEFAIAKNWLTDLGARVGCSAENIYVVPGNHDVDRSVILGRQQISLAQQAITGAPHNERERQLRIMLADIDTGPALFLPIEAYNSFAEEYGCSVGPSSHGAWSATLDLGLGYTLKLFGLSSVVCSSCRPPGGDDAPRQNLYLGPFQTALRSDSSEVVAVMCHHPPDWMLDADRVERDLKNKAKLHFLGHKHDRDVTMAQTFVRFGAGAVSPDRREQEWQPGYNVVELEVIAADSHHWLHVRAEVWAWQENPGLFRKHLTADREERWAHRLKLPARRLDGQMAPLPTEPPPPNARGVPRDVITEFWALPNSSKAEIGRKLGLLTEDEARLPERYRFNNVFERARRDGKTDQLAEEVRARRGIK